MKLNVFQKFSGLLLVGLLGTTAQAQDIPASASGTYTLTYAFAQSGSPFTNGTVKTFVLNGTTDTLCVDGVSLGTGYTQSGSSEIFWNGGGGVYYAVSFKASGALNEVNVNSPTDSGSNWKGQFPGPGTFSSSVTCAAAAPTLTADQQAVIDIAAGLYPDLFLGAGTVGSAQGYTYQPFSSGVIVGFKDGQLYVTGGPFGSAIEPKGSVAAVTANLTSLKNSVNVTPTADMTSVLTLAAQVYPNLFSGTGSEFRTSADGYLYQYFANTGIYAAFKNGNVYVKGGSLGNAYTSVGALNAVLANLNAAINGGGGSIPSGNYNLVVSGTVSILGISQPFSFQVNGIPAPDVSDQDDIEEAFRSALTSTSGLTINSFTYNVVSSTSNLVEFNVTVSATITTSGFATSYSYNLNYKYTK
jgi:hypothetical protein